MIHIDRDFVVMTMDQSTTYCGKQIGWRDVEEERFVDQKYADQADCPVCIERFRADPYKVKMEPVVKTLDLTEKIKYFVDKETYRRHLVADLMRKSDPHEEDFEGVTAEAANAEIDRLVGTGFLTECIDPNDKRFGRGFIVVTEWCPNASAAVNELNAQVRSRNAASEVK